MGLLSISLFIKVFIRGTQEKQKRKKTREVFCPAFVVLSVEGIRDKLNKSITINLNVKSDAQTNEKSMKSRDATFEKLLNKEQSL